MRSDRAIENGETIVPYEHWYAQLERLRDRFTKAQPFPHIVLDDFLVPEAAAGVLAEFPGTKSAEWIHYVHVNEHKYGKNDRASFGPATGTVVDELNSARFLRFLTDLTGIDALLADSTLEGGGLHQSGRGGFLNVHADFTVHPHRRNWQRRLNILVYFNHGWQESWGGFLEFWDAGVQHRCQLIAPLFNRCVIFCTDPTAYHGHPDPMTCPADVTRKSLALYYFTEEARPMVRSTDYRARPGDGLYGLWIYADKMVLRSYDRLKRAFGLDDRFASALLRRLGPRRRK